jgi:ABC-type multidrug transport system fused ATPase/permease subunit
MIAEHARLTQTLVEIRGELDEQLRAYLKIQAESTERAHKQTALIRASLESDRHRFDELLARATASGLPTDSSEPIPASFDGHPVELFAQMVDRLEEAISHAEHTQAALAAERQRRQERSNELERERRRRMVAEQNRLDRARSHDRILVVLGLIAVASCVLSAIVLTTAVGLLAPAAGTAALSYATATSASTLVPRLGRPWSSRPALAYDTGQPPWIASTAATALFGFYALASLAGGLSLDRFGAGSTVALLCGAATTIGHSRAQPSAEITIRENKD